MKTGNQAAIIGAGMMGRWHADAARHAGQSICLVIDPNEEAGKTLASSVGAKWAAEITALWGSGATSAHVCSSSGKHAEHITAVLAAGMSCLAEKPIAASSAETALLFEKAEKASRILCASHQFLFQRGTLSVFGNREALGSVRHTLSVCCTAGAQDETTATSVIADIVPHPLSVLRHFIGQPFNELSWSAKEAGPGEILITAVSSGATHTVMLSSHGRPTRNDLTLIGDAASAHLDFFHGFGTIERGKVSRVSKAARPIVNASSQLLASVANLSSRAIRGETAFPGLRELVRRFYSAIEKGEASGPVTPSETIDVARARDVILSLIEPARALS